MAEKKKIEVNELVYIQYHLKAPKNQRNNFGGYNYRSCEDIMEAVKPLLYETNCTLTVSDEVVVVADRIYVKATAILRTPSGLEYQNSAFAREPISKKGQDESQITGAASSYARKYALNGLFCIDDTKDADAINDNGSQQKQARQQKPLQQTVDMNAVNNEIASCKDMDSLMAIWNKYPSLQGDKNFRDAWAVKRGQIGG